MNECEQKKLIAFLYERCVRFVDIFYILSNIIIAFQKVLYRYNDYLQLLLVLFLKNLKKMSDIRKLTKKIDIIIANLVLKQERRQRNKKIMR